MKPSYAIVFGIVCFYFYVNSSDGTEPETEGGPDENSTEYNLTKTDLMYPLSAQELRLLGTLCNQAFGQNATECWPYYMCLIAKNLRLAKARNCFAKAMNDSSVTAEDCARHVKMYLI